MHQYGIPCDILCIGSDRKALNALTSRLSGTESDQDGPITIGKGFNLFLSSAIGAVQTFNKAQHYDQAIFVLNDLDLRAPTDKDDVKVVTSYQIIQMLHYLQFKKVMVVLEGEEFEQQQQKNDRRMFDWVLDQYKKIALKSNYSEPERNPFQLPEAELVCKAGIRSEDVFAFFNTSSRIEAKELVVQVLEPAKTKLKLRILQGLLTVGTPLRFSGRIVGTVRQISHENQKVNYAYSGQIVIIDFLQVGQEQISGIGLSYFHEMSYQLSNVTVELVFQTLTEKEPRQRINYMSGATQLIWMGNEYDISTIKLDDTLDKLISEQSYQKYTITLTLKKPISYFSTIKDLGILRFTYSPAILGYVRICPGQGESKKIAVNPITRMILPKFSSPPSQLLMEGNQDARYLCRICKQQNFSALLVDCGHLRYCPDCVAECIQQKLCFYCEKPANKQILLTFTYVSEELYATCKRLSGEQVIQYFLSEEHLKLPVQLQELPPYLSILNELQKQDMNVQDLQFCHVCNINLFAYYQCCQNQDSHLNWLCEQHIVKECLKCQQQVGPKMQLIYRFPDDPL